MDDTNLSVASTYINNLLLSRGLLKNGKNIDFAHPEHCDGGIDGTMAKVMGLIHDLILRRDRDSQQRESLTTTLRTLKSDSQNTVTELERLTTKFGDATRKLGLADAAERTLKLQLRSAEAAAKGLKDEMARMRSLVAQTRAMCANEVRKRERTIEGLKRHVGEGGRARGAGKAIGAAIVTVNAGVGGGESANTSDVVGQGYDLRSETNEFLTELASGLSEDNEKVGALLRRTVDSLKALSGWEREGQQEGGLIVSTEEGYEAVAAEADNVVEHLRTLLTNPSFVPLEEVELREEEIFRLREGWERMEARWRDAVKMMDGWRKRMAKTGQTINLEELKMGMSLSPVKEGDEEEEQDYRDTNDLGEEFEEGYTQADIDAMDDSQVPLAHIDEMSDASSFEEEEEEEDEDLLQTQEDMQDEDDIEEEEEDVLGNQPEYEQEEIRLREQQQEVLRAQDEASARLLQAVKEAKEAEEAERIRQLLKSKQEEEDALIRSQQQEKRLARQQKEAEEAKAAKKAAAEKAEAARIAKEATEAKKRQQHEEDEFLHKQEQEKRKARQVKEAEEARAARDASATKRRAAQAPKPQPPKELESRKKRKSAGELDDESAKKRVASQEKIQPSLRSSTRTRRTEVEVAPIEEVPADAPRFMRSSRGPSTATKKDAQSSSPVPAPPKLSPLHQFKADSPKSRKVEHEQRQSVQPDAAEKNTPELAVRPTINRQSASQQAMQFSPIKSSSLSREYHPSPILEAPSLAPSQPRTSSRKPSKATKPWDENVALSPVKGGKQDSATTSSTSAQSAKKLSATLPPSKRLPAPRGELPQQSPLTMASIAAKLAATEREADAARVRAKLKAAKASRGAARTAMSASTTTKVPIKTGDTPATEMPADVAEAAPSERKRRPTSKPSSRSRRRSTLSPWELESLMMGGVQESPSK